MDVRTRQGRADVNAIAGKVLTVYYLAHERDEQPWITIEVDFTAFKPNADGVTAGGAAAEPGPATASRAERQGRGVVERLQRLWP